MIVFIEEIHLLFKSKDLNKQKLLFQTKDEEERRAKDNTMPSQYRIDFGQVMNCYII